MTQVEVERKIAAGRLVALLQKKHRNGEHVDSDVMALVNDYHEADIEIYGREMDRTYSERGKYCGMTDREQMIALESETA